jgi:hypothetical protein
MQDLTHFINEGFEDLELNEKLSKDMKTAIDKKLEISQMAIDKWGSDTYKDMKTRLEDIKAGKIKMTYDKAPMVQGAEVPAKYNIFSGAATDLAKKIAKIVKKYKKYEAEPSSTGAAVGWSGTARATQSGFIKPVANGTWHGAYSNKTLLLGVKIGSTVDKKIQEKLKQELFEAMYPYDEYNSSDGGVMYEYKYGTNFDTIGLTSSKFGFNDNSAKRLEDIMNGK